MREKYWLIFPGDPEGRKGGQWAANGMIRIVGKDGMVSLASWSNECDGDIKYYS